MQIKTDDFFYVKNGEIKDKTKSKGGANLDELRSGLQRFAQRSEELKGLVESRVEEIMREEGWGILWTPPYCPKFQPIELFWRDTKNAAAQEWSHNRTTPQACQDIMDFWFGTDETRHTKRVRRPVPSTKFIKYITKSRYEVGEWIREHGVRLKGGLGQLEVIAGAEYEDDGSIGPELDAPLVDLEDGVVIEPDQEEVEPE